MTVDPGLLNVVLDVRGARVHRVTITSTRPVAAKALERKDVHAALPMVPLLFSLCSAAQAVCALRAAQRALGVTPDAWTHALGSVVILLESLQLHAMTVAVDWRAHCGLPPALEPVRQLTQQLQAVRAALGIPKARFVVDAVHRKTPPRDVAAAWQQVRARAQDVFGPPPSEDLSQLEAWSTTPAPAPAIMRFVLERGLAGVGAAEPSFLPTLEPAQWRGMLEQDQMLELTPELHGRPAETGALARQHKDRRVAAMLARHGSGLGTRILARVVDAHQMLEQLDALLLDEATPPLPPEPPGPHGEGTACVETARGTLVHHVALKGTQVERWRVVAPTEWNFHPRGPAHQALLGVEAAGSTHFETAARLLVGMLDPCVEYDLRVHHA